MAVRSTILSKQSQSISDHSDRFSKTIKRYFSKTLKMDGSRRKDEKDEKKVSSNKKKKSLSKVQDQFQDKSQEDDTKILVDSS